MRKLTILLILFAFVLGCEKAPNNMVLVESGEFTMGSNTSDPDDGPERVVSLDSFYIDTYEVTNAEYREFVREKKHREPRDWIVQGWRDDKANNPVVFVSFDDSWEFCQWREKRLPTELEWERAARGTDARTYPWGDEFDRTKANTSLSGIVGTVAVTRHAEGASPVGALNMAGNVWEWTTSDYSDKTKVIRGGSWGLTHRFSRTFTRVGYAPKSRINNLGFRCAKDN